MHWFFAEPQQRQGECFVLAQREAIHATRVLRLKTGSRVVVFDGCGTEYQAVLAVEGSRVSARIESAVCRQPPSVAVTLAVAVPKKYVFDDIVDQATQLGVSAIVPILTARTEVRFSSEQEQKKTERWQTIAVEASKQSQRAYVPTVSPPVAFGSVPDRLKDFDCVLFGWPAAPRIPARETLRQCPVPRSVMLLIGPEGDFTEKEQQQAVAAGAIPIWLGPAILRVPTAAAALIGMVMYEWSV